MKKTAILIATLLGALTSFAQTAITTYQPGVSTEGATYYLPKTIINVSLTIEKKVYTPGELSQYADRYLRINNVADKENQYYELKSATLTTMGVPDEKKLFHIQFTSNSVAPLVHLNESGVLLGINTDLTPIASEAPTIQGSKQQPVDPRTYLTEEMLMVTSKAKMAELVAKEIYDIRESRNLLLRGQNDNMPKDGEALKIILKGMEEQEQALMQLFIGTTITETTTHTYQVIPDNETERALLGRFSRKLGLLHKDDLAGAPIYIDITNKNTVPAPAPEAEANDKKTKLKGKKNSTKQDGLIYNLPGKADIKVYSNNTIFAEECLSLSQFGNTETLSSSLFSKKKDIKVTLDPHTGALLKVEE